MTEPKHRQRLAAILAADAAGYSRLMALDDHATVAALDAARAAFDQAIESNKGRVIDMAGDSVLAVFETATGAVVAAVEVQESLKDSLLTAVKDEHLKFRIGVHLGDVIEKEDGSIYGDGVNIAARLEGLAEPGGIVISDSVHGAVRGRITGDFEDAGEHQVKNIAHPVRAYCVNSSGTTMRRPGARAGIQALGKRAIAMMAVAGVIGVSVIAWWLSDNTREIAAEDVKPMGDQSIPPTVAVLKFRRFDQEKDSALVSASFSEDLIHELARDKDFRVISRHSSFSSELAVRSAEQVAKLLGAQYLIDGRVGIDDDQLRVQMTMTDGRTGHVVWTDKSTTTAENLDETRARQVERIAGTLRTGIKVNEERSVLRRKTSVLNVYALALSVMARKHTFRPDQFRLARQEAQQALDIDPSYAHAWVNLAYLNFIDIVGRVTGEWTFARLGEVDELLERGIGFDPDHPTAWQVRGLIRGIQGRRDEALQAAQRAVQLAPNDADGLLYLALANTMAGKFDEGELYLKRSEILFPIPPLQFWQLGARVKWAAKKYDSAIDMSNQCIQITPKFYPCWTEKIAALVESNRIEEAKKAMTQMLHHFPKSNDPFFIKAFAGSPLLSARRTAAAEAIELSPLQQ